VLDGLTFAARRLAGRPAGGRAGPPARRARGRPEGIGRASSLAAERLSDELRGADGDPLMTRRRRIAALAVGGAGAMGVISLYQLGIVRHLPEPPLPWLDADRVDASGEAYRLGHVPDAAPTMAWYGLTLALAAAGGRDRPPWLPLALAGKVVADAASAVLLTVEQASRHRAFCGWCLLAAGASVAMVPQALPEARAAWRQLRG
jgi:uncharacterized membrane protein